MMRVKNRKIGRRWQYHTKAIEGLERKLKDEDIYSSNRVLWMTGETRHSQSRQGCLPRYLSCDMTETSLEARTHISSLAHSWILFLSNSSSFSFKQSSNWTTKQTYKAISSPGENAGRPAIELRSTASCLLPVRLNCSMEIEWLLVVPLLWYVVPTNLSLQVSNSNQ